MSKVELDAGKRASLRSDYRTFLLNVSLYLKKRELSQA